MDTQVTYYLKQKVKKENPVNTSNSDIDELKKFILLKNCFKRKKYKFQLTRRFVTECRTVPYKETLNITSSIVDRRCRITNKILYSITETTSLEEFSKAETMNTDAACNSKRK